MDSDNTMINSRSIIVSIYRRMDDSSRELRNDSWYNPGTADTPRRLPVAVGRLTAADCDARLRNDIPDRVAVDDGVTGPVGSSRAVHGRSHSLQRPARVQTKRGRVSLRDRYNRYRWWRWQVVSHRRGYRVPGGSYRTLTGYPLWDVRSVS